MMTSPASGAVQSSAGGTPRSALQADDARRFRRQHRRMPNLIYRNLRRPYLLLVVLLAGVAALAGCGGGNSEVAAAGLPNSRAATALQNRFVNVVDHMSPEVVQVRTPDGLGSGIVYDHRGDVVTNAHVTANQTRFVVTLSDGDRRSATLVGSDPGHDVAVMRLAGKPPAPAAFADSSAVRSGDIVFAVGNPLGLQSSVTQGIVSSINRSVSEGNGVTLSQAIQTSAEINPGNSGGALADLSGRVVGIPTLAAVDPEFGGAQAPGIGFAIPSDTVQQVANRLIAAGQST